MPVVHDVYGLLQCCQADTDRHEDDHIKQPIAVVWCIAALEQLRTSHQPTGRQHDPHRNGYATLTRVFAIQLDPYTFVSDIQANEKTAIELTRIVDRMVSHRKCIDGSP